MAVTYGFFNSVNGDRKYNAEQMSEYFRGIVNEGVFQHLDGGLAVTAGTGLAVSVASGRAIIQNRWVQNSDAMTLSISAASETYARKDAVVIRLNYSTRSIEIAVKAGTPAASPVAPSMTRNSTTYEMALAYVNVAANATSVTITDKRSDSTVCGWATVAQATSGEVDAQLNAMKTGFDGVEYDSPVKMVQGCDQKLSDEISRVKEATILVVKPDNMHNPDTDVAGVLVYTGKTINPDAVGITTDFIPVNAGDIVYYTSLTASDAYQGIGTIVCRWLAFYTDKDMETVISCTAYQNSATAPSGAKYLRASFSVTTNKIDSISFNEYPTDIYSISKYFEPYYNNNARLNMMTKVIDCWGDSRTAMNNDGTSYTDYLNTLLGDDFTVCNYGITSQSSGQIAMRLGANEVYISLTGNQIPATGSVSLQAIKSMQSDQFSVFAFDPSATSQCILCGIRGRLNRSATGDITANTFIRESDGAATEIRPYSKICVDDMGSDHHICVLWWGKNDYSKYKGSSPNPQILDNYKAAVEYLRHDRFIILGETCSISDDYLEGHTYRNFVDSLNNTLNKLYPNNFIDINAWLSSEAALTSVGLTATATDLEYIAKGFPCYQLMRYSTVPSDKVHPNEYGRQAIANRIYSWMVEKGWA